MLIALDGWDYSVFLQNQKVGPINSNSGNILNTL